LWVAILDLTKPEDPVNIYRYRTHTMYGTFQQINQDFLPQIEQALMANGWNISNETLEREDSHDKALQFIKIETGKIIKI
jgi:hypothetical protein